MLRRNAIPVLLGIISGVILVLTNTRHSTGYLVWAQLFIGALRVTSPISDIILLFLSFIELLALLGGGTVLLGSILVMARLHRIGAWIMSIGAGVSLIGLIWKLMNIAIQWLVYNDFLGAVNNFANNFQGIAWIGAILAVVAQEWVKIPAKKPKVPEEPLEEISEEPEPKSEPTKEESEETEKASSPSEEQSNPNASSP